jgi:hypothetical protein
LFSIYYVGWEHWDFGRADVRAAVRTEFMKPRWFVIGGALLACMLAVLWFSLLTNEPKAYAQSGTAPAIPVFAPDPCQSPTTIKSFAPIAISGVATTQIVALSGVTQIFVCGFMGAGGGTSPTLQFVYGTGSNCATGTTNLTGAFLPGSGSTSSYTPGMTGFKAAAGNALCLTQTGTAPSYNGVITYVQQ